MVSKVSIVKMEQTREYKLIGRIPVVITVSVQVK